MITTKSFHKEIGSVDAEVFRFIGGSALDSALTVVLENESSVNSIVYKVQESSDGDTWTDKALPTGSGTSISFTVAPETAHTIKLPQAAGFYRFVARGTCNANIGLTWFTRVGLSGASQILA